MSVLFDELQLGKLSAAQRLELVGDIWDSLAAEVEAAPLPPALCEELDRRIAAHRADPNSAIPWEEVQLRVHARLQNP
jgi:putative addiction module component (TIGR02574 family)